MTITARTVANRRMVTIMRFFIAGVVIAIAAVL
jgi:hypothetical protein